MSWRIVYSHDKNGNKTGGDINILKAAIENGSSLKVVAHITNPDGSLKYKICEYAIRVWVDEDRVYASTLQYHYNFCYNEATALV